MINIEDYSEDEITRRLTYSGFALLSFELVKSLIVSPIKAFYWNTTFNDGVFKSYEEDVLSRHNNEFEACLLYLRDFMEALDSNDVLTIQALRKHRNDIAHELTSVMERDPNQFLPLLEKVDATLFKLSNYRTYMEIGADPAFKDKGIDWDTIYGAEYAIFKELVAKVKILQIPGDV
tara:strand:+ start:728 stop:1258 length:531 start_codon:yes stop_codon:yes gene_type:complete